MLVFLLLMHTFLAIQAQAVPGAQEKWHTAQILWASPATASPADAFAADMHFSETAVPYAFALVEWKENYALLSAEISDAVYENVSHPDAAAWYQQLETTEKELKTEIIQARNKKYLKISLLPYKLNSSSAGLQRITAYSLLIRYTETAPEEWQRLLKQSDSSFANSSVLASGNWYKVAVASDGIFRLTYSDLSSMGINVNSIDPRQLRLFGNGGGMLPEANSAFRYDDLYENAIWVAGEEDGSFDPSDYVLFYGQGPHRWNYDQTAEAFHHSLHLYTDKTVYFLTIGPVQGKRIGQVNQSPQAPTHQVSSFDDYAFYEQESYNLIKSGKDWYGEKFDVITRYDLPDFSFPNHDMNQAVYLRAAVAAKSTSISSFGIFLDGVQVVNPMVASVPAQAYNTDYAKKAEASRKMLMTSSDFDLEVEYYATVSNSVGWLDFVEVNVRRHLRFGSGQLNFRDAGSVGLGNISRFTLTSAPSSLKVWEVSNPLEPALINASVSGSELSFVVATDLLREFVAFDGSAFKQAELIGKIPNQNLHGLPVFDMIIVSHPDFFDQANRLAQLHNVQDNYSVIVVTPAEIYNEFSSGVQDISAIRDFIRMIYQRSNSQTDLKYVLLFGDASYDPKNRLPDNQNFIPTFQTRNSLQPTASYATDDFFVLMDDGEGQGASGTPDLGIGRFPVSSPAQAKTAVDKIVNYTSNGLVVPSSYGVNLIPALADWRNVLTYVADDQDGNLHQNQAEELADYVQNRFREYNIDKIYLDAYPQVSTPGGQRYPEVNKAINDRINKGTLIFNYTGHGGETGLAQERVLEIQDILSWKNPFNLPVFVTATCEFSRYDDPQRTSAGELTFLKSDGGAISLFTTSRLSFSSSNFALNLRFYEKVFNKIDGVFPRMGDVIRLAKTPSNPNIRNFVLLGDPALRLAYPEHQVYTTEINGKPIDGTPDTLKALSKITIKGKVVDATGQLLPWFNGIIYPSVFDKPAEVITRGNDQDSSPMKFYIQKNLLYKGKASVVNGWFEFTFVVPKDIAYRLDYGRISYYASDGFTDATGFYENILIGGSSPDAPVDEDGPAIRLYLNDTNFVMHGITDEKPILLAFVEDSSGINTVGNGIGHDIVAILDGKTDAPYVLNDYYEADLDSYQRGTIRYPFSGLSEGKHSLELKVWDVYNNSSTAYIEFYVSASDALALSQLINYPNPFYGQTNFVFEHNQPGRSLDIDIRIYAMDGRLAHQIRQNVTTSGYRTNPIPWDGRTTEGAPLPGGIYIYRVSVNAGEGVSNEMSDKLIILR